MNDLQIKIEEIKKKLFPKIKKFLNRFPLVKEVLSMYYALMDDLTPISIKVSIAGALLYFILPLDTIPDFILGLGLMDDIGVILFIWNRISPYITEEHKRKAKEYLENI